MIDKLLPAAVIVIGLGLVVMVGYFIYSDMRDRALRNTYIDSCTFSHSEHRGEWSGVWYHYDCDGQPLITKRHPR